MPFEAGRKRTRSCIHVGVGVLGLAVLLEHTRGNLAVLLDELEKRVLHDFFPVDGEVHQCFETGVGFAEHGVSVSWNNLSTLESRPDIFLNSLIGCIDTNLLLHLSQPDKHFLVSKTKKITQL